MGCATQISFGKEWPLACMQKLIIDTDPGQDIDDLLVLAFALQRPELDIKAITTVTYPANKRARLVKRLLRYLDRTDIPVAAGEPWPMSPISDAVRQWQSVESNSINHYGFAEPEEQRDDPGADHAVDLLIRTVEAHPGEIGIACIAPLSNIALALKKKPDLARAIKYIALMGGETELNRLEHNVAYDYLAAEIVLTSGIPVYMGTWDITRRFVLTQEDCALFHQSASPLCQALGKAIEAWHPAQPWKPYPVMYDMFPIAWSMDPICYELTPKAVKIETRGDHTRGMTVVRGHDPAPISVTTGIDVPRLREWYLKTMFPAT